ncbi:hypothetical protein C8R44DRAFT_751160 [Mycena epipterygia]|nr:hypothetical protein C8R44DRAFT_751160 [Mycena epipterygia]
MGQARGLRAYNAPQHGEVCGRTTRHSTASESPDPPCRRTTSGSGEVDLMDLAMDVTRVTIDKSSRQFVNRHSRHIHRHQVHLATARRYPELRLIGRALLMLYIGSPSAIQEITVVLPSTLVIVIVQIQLYISYIRMVAKFWYTNAIAATTKNS